MERNEEYSLFTTDGQESESSWEGVGELKAREVQGRCTLWENTGAGGVRVDQGAGSEAEARCVSGHTSLS